MHLVRCVGIDSKSMPALNSIEGHIGSTSCTQTLFHFFELFGWMHMCVGLNICVRVLCRTCRT